LKILILEEALQSGNGHWPVYIGDIARACRQAGHQVDVLAHRNADRRLLEELQAVPWFSHNCWTNPSRQGGLGGLKHALRYGREVARWLRKVPETTWVCALTMRLQHLLAFSLLCRRPWHSGSHRYLLLFVQGFGVYQGRGLPVNFPHTTSTRLARWCFKRLAPSVRSGRVLLAAETRAMQAELESFTQLPVHLFPHPVSPAPESRVTVLSRQKGQSTTTTITCPGFARYEKGNDLLQDACRQLFEAEPIYDLQVISQWPEPFTLPDGSEVRPDPELLATGRYQLINQGLDRQGYANLLARSDLVVLPYRRSSYHNRVSRIAIEAALQGIPLVVMSGTWCEEVVKLTQAGTIIDEEDADSVYKAVLTAIKNLPQLQSKAKIAIHSIKDTFSPEYFQETLLSVGNRDS
jgi:glycosyltransferase involved in cell wall biosynthesis